MSNALQKRPSSALSQRVSTLIQRPLVVTGGVVTVFLVASAVPGLTVLVFIGFIGGGAIWLHHRWRSDQQLQQLQQLQQRGIPPLHGVPVTDNAAQAEFRDAYQALLRFAPQLADWEAFLEPQTAAQRVLEGLAARQLFMMSALLNTSLAHPLLAVELSGALRDSDIRLGDKVCWHVMPTTEGTWLVVALARARPAVTGVTHPMVALASASSTAPTGQRVLAAMPSYPAAREEVVQPVKQKNAMPMAAAPQGGAVSPAYDGLLVSLLDDWNEPEAAPPTTEDEEGERWAADMLAPPVDVADWEGQGNNDEDPAALPVSGSARGAVARESHEADDALVGPEDELLRDSGAAAQDTELVEGMLVIDPRARIIEQKLAEFRIGVKVTGVIVGPTVTQFALVPEQGVTVQKVVTRLADIALALGLPNIRVEPVIPGMSAMGIEVPNKVASSVPFSPMLDVLTKRGGPGKLLIPLGVNVRGDVVSADLARLPHLLVAGTTGSGKSVVINGFICGLLHAHGPDSMQLLLIDPKQVEFAAYSNLPHLVRPVVTEAKDAVAALRWALMEMERRYNVLVAAGCKDIHVYRERGFGQSWPMPFLVIVIDEYADLLVGGEAVDDAEKVVELMVRRLAQKARGAGIHLIVATQRPSVDVITGVIKGNIPARLALAVTSEVDSRVILDRNGAEQLLGRGDMLYLSPDASLPVRLQGAYVSDADVQAILARFVGQQRLPLPAPSPAPAAGPSQAQIIAALVRRWPVALEPHLRRILADRRVLHLLATQQRAGVSLPCLRQDRTPLSGREWRAALETPAMQACVREARQLSMAQKDIARLLFGTDSDGNLTTTIGKV